MEKKCVSPVESYQTVLFVKDTSRRSSDNFVKKTAMDKFTKNIEAWVMKK